MLLLKGLHTNTRIYEILSILLPIIDDKVMHRDVLQQLTLHAKDDLI